MNTWECGVCGYLHKEGEAPESCPICEAPAVMFKEKVEKQSEEDTTEKTVDTDSVESGEQSEIAQEDSETLKTAETQETVGAQEAAETHETAEAEKATEDDKTDEKAEGVEEIPDASEGEIAAIKRWRCSVCGYVHTGEEPPEKCPICDAPKKMFVEIDDEDKALTEVDPEDVGPDGLMAGGPGQKQSSGLLDKLANLSLKLHLHPITVHFPNGILPAVLVFLGIGVYFKIELLQTAAHYNLIFVLLMLPIVILTGFIEWQKRYKGIKTMIFIVKIICSLIVLAAVNVLVFWRLIDPAVLAEGSPTRLIYLGVAGGMLAAAALAGHLGGKLVFGPRD